MRSRARLPAATVLLGAFLAAPARALGVAGGTTLVLDEGLLFANGFESGDTAAWSPRPPQRRRKRALIAARVRSS